MSEPLDKKELGHYQKRTEKKNGNAEIIIEIITGAKMFKCSLILIK